MARLTYADLRDKINEFTDEQLDMEVTVHDGEEFHLMNSLAITDTTDVLDEGHPYLFYFG